MNTDLIRGHRRLAVVSRSRREMKRSSRTLPAGPYAQEVVAQLASMLACDAERTDELARLSGAVVDWEPLVACASRNEVLAALHYNLRRSGVELPRDVDVAIQKDCFVRAAPQLEAVATLFDVVEALEEAAVPAVALKGPILAERIYPERSLRFSSDLDVMIPFEAIDRALEALAARGYYLGETAAADRYYRASHYQLIVLHPKRSTMVELHFRAIRAFGSALDADPFLERSTWYTSTTGGRVRILAPDDELLYLLVHAAKHFAFHLKWFYDLLLFVRAHPDVELARVLERADEIGVGRGVRFALEQLEALFGAMCVAGVSVEPGRIRSRLVTVVRRLDVRVEHTGGVSTLLALAYGALLADTASRSANVLLSGAGRIARRRAHRYAPTVVPADWSA